MNWNFCFSVIQLILSVTFQDNTVLVLLLRMLALGLSAWNMIDSQVSRTFVYSFIVTEFYVVFVLFYLIMLLIFHVYRNLKSQSLIPKLSQSLFLPSCLLW